MSILSHYMIRLYKKNIWLLQFQKLSTQNNCCYCDYSYSWSHLVVPYIEDFSAVSRWKFNLTTVLRLFWPLKCWRGGHNFRVRKWTPPCMARLDDFNCTSADMIFVKNFTRPDFQAKSFTLQKCVICYICSRKLTAKMHQISIIGSFIGYKWAN